VLKSRAVLTLVLSLAAGRIAAAQAPAPSVQASLVSDRAPTPPDTDYAKPDTTPPAAKPEGPKTPHFTFGAWLFGNFQYETDSLTQSLNGGNSVSRFQLERAYLTFRGNVGGPFSFRITTDIKVGALSSGYNGLFVRLKYGYLQWDYIAAKPKTGLAAWARIGMIHTVLIDDEERFWPRYIQKVPVEYYRFMSSSDLGASTQLTLPNSWGVAYLTVANGPGYESAEIDRYKDVALRVSLTPFGRSTGLLKTFEISPWGQLGETQGTAVTTPGLTRNRWGVVVENGDPRLTFGVEYAQMNNDIENVGPPVTVTSVTSPLWDAFLIVRPFLFGNPKGMPVGLLARYDQFKPNSSSGAYQSYGIFGVFVEPIKGTSFALDYQQQKPHNGLAIPTLTVWYLHWQTTF
jgi:hypothetical protein